MTKKMVTENTYSWMKVQAAEMIVGIAETFGEELETMRLDITLYMDFIGANQIVDEVEAKEKRPMYAGWDAFREARQWYKEDQARIREGGM